MTTIWIMVIIGAAQFVLFAWSLSAAVRLHRRLQHAYTLDKLLARLCYKAFVLQHQPIWAAWSAVLGDFVVEINQTRHIPGDEA